MSPGESNRCAVFFPGFFYKKPPDPQKSEPGDHIGPKKDLKD